MSGGLNYNLTLSLRTYVCPESLNYLFTTTQDACFDHVYSEIYEQKCNI